MFPEEIGKDSNTLAPAASTTRSVRPVFLSVIRADTVVPTRSEVSKKVELWAELIFVPLVNHSKEAEIDGSSAGYKAVRVPPTPKDPVSKTGEFAVTLEFASATLGEARRTRARTSEMTLRT